MVRLPIIYNLLFIVLISCQDVKTSDENADGGGKDNNQGDIQTNLSSQEIPEGMIFIQGGTFIMGSEDPSAKEIEGPEHPVVISSFYMDETEVTNAQFASFVEATGYVTVAERPVDWEEIKKQLPPNTPRPADSMLEPGSLVFEPIPGVTNLYDISQWWKWQKGADWRHPLGPKSHIEGKENHRSCTE